MSIAIRNTVNGIVDWYSEKEKGLVVLDIQKIPEHDLNALAALILADDPMLASEASGPDNPEWEKSMESALIRTLQKPRDQYVMEEFHDIWTSGVRHYLMPRMKRMIDDRLEELNEDMECNIRLVWNRREEKVLEVSA